MSTITQTWRHCQTDLKITPDVLGTTVDCPAYGQRSSGRSRHWIDNLLHDGQWRHAHSRRGERCNLAPLIGWRGHRKASTMNRLLLVAVLSVAVFPATLNAQQRLGTSAQRGRGHSNRSGAVKRIGGATATSPLSKPTSSNLPTSQVSFSVRGSKLGSHTWRDCGLKLKAGQWVLAETKALAALDNPNLPNGSLALRMKDRANLVCRFSYRAGTTRGGSVRRLAFQARENCSLVYATENAVHLEVKLTVTKERPAGVQVANVSAGAAPGGAAGTITCPQCQATGKYRVPSRAGLPGFTMPCPTCQGTGMTTQQGMNHYRKSVVEIDKHVAPTK
ncbi:MAG: hypothetical protein ACI96M_002874 [Candidatus Azotimanducaceae bacterium]|jgi:hypothetical protein